MSSMWRAMYWAVLIANMAALADYAINGVDQKWRPLMSGFFALWTLLALRNDAMAEAKKPELEVKR